MPGVLVFRTTLSSYSDLLRVQPELDHACQRWTVDLDDCDRVLRVEGEASADEIERILREAGFQCEELEDELV